MTRALKLLAKALARNKNLRFEELTALAEAFGFELARISGRHPVYVHARVMELVSLQSVRGRANPFQVRQFLELVEMYNLSMGDRP